MGFLDRITGKQKILQEIRSLASENEKLLDVNKTLKAENENLKEELNFIKKREKELTSKNTEQKELCDKYIKKINCLSNNNAIMENSLNAFKDTYGEIAVAKNIDDEDLEVKENDPDKVFFDDMVDKNDGHQFNKEQIRAIRYNSGHLRLIAGAGSGKTQTICAKAVYLNQMEKVDFKRICMITFTRKAAGELKDRIKYFASNDSNINKMTLGTFNSVFNKIVKSEFIGKNILSKEEASKLNIILPQKSSVENDEEDNYDKQSGLDENKYEQILNQLIKEHGLEKFEENEKGDKSIKDRIDYWLSLDYSYKEIRESLKLQYDQKYFKIFGENTMPLSERFYNLLITFQERRKNENVMVFNDQILNMKKALQEEKAKNYIQNRFDYIFIDEFQDTNQLQINILKLLSPPDKQGAAKIIIVGDPNQSIYAFRGCDSSYIQEFHKIYPSIITENLLMNYRSKKDTVQKANKLIANNEDNKVEPMDWFNDKDNTVIVKKNKNLIDEAEYIIDKIIEHGCEDVFTYKDNNTNEEAKDKDNPNYTNSAILYRSKYQIDIILKKLIKRKIPFVIEEEIDLKIFKMKDFKQIYAIWLKLTKLIHNMDKQNEENLYEYNRLLNQYWVSNKDIENYKIDNDIDSLNVDNVIDIVRKENKSKISKIVKGYERNILNYVKLLKDLKNKKSVKPTQLIDCIIDFPVYQKSEDTWKNIKNELEVFDTVQQVEEWRKNAESINGKRKENFHKYESKMLNAVYLLTIHKSKGLDFKNTFIVGCYDGGIPADRAVNANIDEIEKAKRIAAPLSTISEERRLMYVALTRAKNNAYITFPMHIDDKPQKPSVFISEILK